MSSSRVLLLTGGGARVYRWDGRRMLEPLGFSADETGIGGFSEFLRLSGRGPFRILIDVVEEDFRLDTVPHVFGRDRAAVVRSKQTRMFRDSRYSRAIFQGRELDGRRDDKVLFTSIIRPEILDPWLAQLHRFKVPVVGIYSLPVLSQRLLKRIPVRADNALLVTLHPGGGLRQTYFEQSHLKLSRLAAMPRLEASRVASYVLQEVERVRRYLNSLRLLGRGGPLDVFILGHAALLSDLRRQAKDTVLSRFHLVDLEEVARKSRGDGLTAPGQPYADRVFAHLLATERPVNFYATSQDTRYHTLACVGAAMTAAGVLILIGSLAWGGFEFASAVDRQLQIATLAKQARFYESRYRRGKEQLPDLPADGREIRHAVQMVGTVVEYLARPVDMMATVSRGLEGFSDLRIDELDWESSADPDGAGRRARSIRSPRSRRGRRARPEPEQPAGYFQIATLGGHVESFNGNYREALDRVNRFADALGALRGVESVKVLKLPLDISSRRRLAGVATGTADVGDALFEIKVVLRTRGDPGGS